MSRKSHAGDSRAPSGAGAAPAFSALYAGDVMHQRLRPVRHRLSYRVFSLLVDLDETRELNQRLRLFSMNRFNVFSLHDRDYGAGDGRSIRQHAQERLREAGFRDIEKIRLLTMPRIFGYAFNPLSVYFCHGSDGRLRVMIHEVNNTFGERHSYMIAVDEDQRDHPVVTQTCEKVFHVSPFLPLDMSYRFRVGVPAPEREGMSLGITASDKAGPVLVAHFASTRKPLTDATLLKAFFSHPLLTLKVIAGIHWEAVKLLVKGVQWRPSPPAPVHPITVVPATVVAHVHSPSPSPSLSPLPAPLHTHSADR